MVATKYKNKFTDEQMEEITSRYLSGTRSGFLAEEYQCSKITINNIAKKLGHEEYVKKNKGGNRGINTDHLIPDVIKLHATGISQQKIADAVGISQAVVSRIFRQNNLKANNPAKNQYGEKNNQWKGGRTLDGNGYIQIKDFTFPEMLNKQGYVAEHRIVMAKYFNRPLTKDETVHHIDGDKTNNKLGNLQFRIGKHGKGSCYKCAECGSVKLTAIEI
jgi:HNH endonuclease